MNLIALADLEIFFREDLEDNCSSSPLELKEVLSKQGKVLTVESSEFAGEVLEVKISDA